MRELPLQDNPRLIVGHEKSDDAGVYLLSDDMALVQTVDFFTPIVDDPYDFGRISAANAFSDIYAMGATPITAMNIVCFPSNKMDFSVLKEIIRGGLDKIHEAEAVLLGGHSVEDEEIKYGLSVTGIVHPERVVMNSGARPGDVLILTKPVGTGILATGLKAGMITEADMFEAIEWMAALNKVPSVVMQKYDVSSCTDITGFGLIGHAMEMARASNVTIEIFSGAVPCFNRAYELASMGMVPAGAYSNRKFCSGQMKVHPDVDNILLDILLDPQTSGGLFISIPERHSIEMLDELKSKGLSHSSIVGVVREYCGFSVVVMP